MVVKTEEGTEHTIHFVGRTVAHGAEATAKGSKDAFEGMKEGDEVVVHYTVKGAVKTADEVDHIGKEGLKVSRGLGEERRSCRENRHREDGAKAPRKRIILPIAR